MLPKLPPVSLTEEGALPRALCGLCSFAVSMRLRPATALDCLPWTQHFSRVPGQTAGCARPAYMQPQ